MMPKWREVDSRAVRLGPYAAAITGAGLAWFSVFIFYALAGKSGHPIYYIIWVLGFAYISFRWWRGFLARKLTTELPADHVCTAIQQEQPTVATYHAPIYYYSEMRGAAKFFYDLSIWISWLVRSVLFATVTYAMVTRVLPPNATDIPISAWTLKLIGSYLGSAWLIFVATYWWVHPPAVQDNSTWDDHPYNMTWGAVALLLAVGGLYYAAFIR